MLVLVQFPFADLRYFVERPPKILGADWTLAPDPGNPDFVRGFGPLRKRPKSDSTAIAAWQGEAWFARAAGAIRFPQITHRDFPRAGIPLVPQHALRRIFCNGKALWRVELGFAFDTRTQPSFTQILAAIGDVLELPVRVRTRGQWGQPAALSQQGEALGNALIGSTTFKDTTEARREMKLRSGRPMVLVETRATDDSSMWKDPTDKAVDTHHVTLEGGSPASRTEVDFGTLAVDRVEWPLVLLRSNRDDGGQATRDVRTHLCRLHAEREVLTQVLRAANKGKVTEASGNLERYLSQAQAELFASERFGVEQNQLRQVFDVYDRIAPSETRALIGVLGDRPQSIVRVESLTGSYREADGRPVIHVFSGGSIVVNDNRVNVGGDNTGIINVAGTFVNTGNIISKSDNNELKTALGSLKTLTEQLTSKLPEPAKQQGVANKLEALTKEATSPEPDHSMLKVTGQGLIDAAKTVAEMAAPIAKAVGAVLGILGLVL